MLQKEIESYEDYLIEKKIIKKVYLEMDLTKHKNIEHVSSKEAIDIAYLFNGNTTLLEEIVFPKRISPIEALLSLFYSKNCPNNFNVDNLLFSPWEVKNAKSKTDKLYSLRYCIEHTVLIMKADNAQYSYKGTPLDTDRIYSSPNRFNAIIDKINLEMSLNDLRNLHEALRHAVRKHKIESAMFSQ